MQTSLTEAVLNTREGQEADAILRRCVHCGFCLATCPTYQLLGDELDSPRGRIYLIKGLLEGQPITETTQLHLDRCLTCRACETTCPSGVEYARLLEIGRNLTEAQVRRPASARVMRKLLLRIAAHAGRMRALLTLARPLQFLLPKHLRALPAPRSGEWPRPRHARRMLILDGCVQSVLQPQINLATARVLDQLGISVVRTPSAGCCGAIAQHMSAEADFVAHAKRNIDTWWPSVDVGAEAIIVTASGCVSSLRDYGYILRHDVQYATRAARISEIVRDISEIIASENDSLRALLERTPPRGTSGPIAFHAPCSLQHGLRLNGVVESLLRAAGFELTPVPDAHLCCGSAGTYSILQPELSQKLLQNKVRALESGRPVAIATANIGCHRHIQSGTALPVRHWIELLAERLG
jgi:glycolate oxidase iron-sulfur subunit